MGYLNPQRIQDVLDHIRSRTAAQLLRHRRLQRGEIEFAANIKQALQPYAHFRFAVGHLFHGRRVGAAIPLGIARQAGSPCAERFNDLEEA